MTVWLDAAGRFFNPEPKVSVLPLPDGRCCVVVDDALANPEGLVAWTSAHVFAPPDGYPYPGLVLPAPAELASRVADLFAQHARQRLGARRTLDVSVRLAMVTVPPAQVERLVADSQQPARLSSDPTRARLTLNGFFTCRRNAS